MNLLLAILLLTVSLDESFLSSSKAYYDGNLLTLEGSVYLKHSLGILQSERAIIRKDSSTDDSFSTIDLYDQVLVHLKNQALLKCFTAHLDFEHLTGHLSSNKKDLVSFEGLIQSQDGPVSCFVESQKMDACFSKQIDSYEIEKLYLQGNVKLLYENDFMCLADEAFYQSSTPHMFSGTFHFKSLESPILLSHLSDRIEATQIMLNLDLETIWIDHPKGVCNATFCRLQDPLRFSASALTWNKHSHELLLDSEIECLHPFLGSFFASEKGIFKKGEDLSISFVELSGSLRWTHEEMRLSTNGRLEIDGIKNTVFLTSIKTPIIYQDLKRSFSANKATLHYTLEPVLSIDHLLVEGDIHFKSGSAFAICDVATYDPKTNTVFLSSKEESHVLFSDPEQALTMSAPQIRISETGGKLEVQGIGRVKFTLSDEENSLLESCRLKGVLQ